MYVSTLASASEKTMKETLLSHLYLSIFVPVLFAWSTDEDLCYFDTAVCNHQLRNYVLSAMTKGFLMNTIFHEKTHAEFVRWLLLRGISVKSFTADYLMSLNDLTLLRPPFQLLSLSASAGSESLSQLSSLAVGIETLKLDCIYGYQPSELAMFGSRICGLKFKHLKNSQAETVASLCPNLKHLSVDYDSRIGSIVNKCSLDTISHCNLAALKQPKCKLNYYCDLKRTTNHDDESSVCLGEGKHYHLTSLSCRHLSAEDVKTLAPLLVNVQSVRLYRSQADARFIMQHCRNLTVLKLLCMPLHCSELKVIMLLNPLLRTIHVQDSSAVESAVVDEFISWVINCCPLLKLYESAPLCTTTAFMSIYDKISADQLSLRVYSSCVAIIHNRRHRIEVGHPSFSNDIFSQLIQRSPLLVSIELKDLRGLSDENLIALKLCLHLARVCIYDSRGVFTGDGIVRGLSHLTALASLHLEYVKILSDDSLTLLVNNCQLRRLILLYCDGFTAKALMAQISQYCPELRLLNVSWNNDEVRNSDVIRMLHCCAALEYLSVSGCSAINIDILSQIKSPPLRFLNVKGTRISRNDMRSGCECLSNGELKYVV